MNADAEVDSSSNQSTAAPCFPRRAVLRSGPDIAGRGIANPTALLLSSVMMLRHMLEVPAADRLQDAIEGVYRDAKHLTGDVGGSSTTSQFADAVIAKLV